MTGQGLCKEERLHSLRRIRNLFGCGESGFVYPYRYLWTVYESGSEQLPLGYSGETAPETRTRVKARRSSRRAEIEAPRPVSVESGVSMMVSVPKKHHKRANKRNLLRRRTKEALRLNKDGINIVAASHGRVVDIALVVATKDIFDYKTAENGVRKILATIGKAV